MLFQAKIRIEFLYSATTYDIRRTTLLADVASFSQSYLYFISLPPLGYLTCPPRLAAMSDVQHKPSKRKAVIIGAGPVGCLTAISFAKTLGWDVELYEARQGPPFFHRILSARLSIKLSSRYASSCSKSRISTAINQPCNLFSGLSRLTDHRPRGHQPIPGDCGPYARKNDS